MSLKKFLVYSNTLFSGVIAVFLSIFFAEGTIAENYSGKTFVAPEFFMILLIWAIVAILVSLFFYRMKINNTSYWIILLLNFMLWLSMPFGFMVSIYFADIIFNSF